MSIANRHPFVRNLIKNTNILATDSIYKSSPQKKWVVIFLKTNFNNHTNEIEKFFYEYTAKNLRNKILIEQIYIYAYENPNNKVFFENAIKQNINLVEISASANINFVKLSIVKKFMDSHANIIFFENGCGYIENNDISKIESIENIYTNFVPVHSLSGKYALIAQNFELDKIINSNILVIPYSVFNHNFIDNCISIANNLKTDDETFATNISLSITNMRCGNARNKISEHNLPLRGQGNARNKISEHNLPLRGQGNARNKISEHNLPLRGQGDPVKNLQSKEFGKNMVSFHNNKLVLIFLAEIYAGKNLINNRIDEIISCNNSEFLFYPHLDVSPCGINLDRNEQLFIPTKVSIESAKINNINNNFGYYKQNMNMLPNYFNTNGFYGTIKSERCYHSLFRRFDDKNSGLYIKKQVGKIIIPQILHCVWLDNNDKMKNYIDAWGKILREPWQYMVWTSDNLNLLLDRDNRWTRLYHKETDTIIKTFIVYMAILEKHGGFVINSYTLPLKLIPEEILINKFVVSFIDENDFGTNLSYQIMASVPGIQIKNKPIINKIDTARRPFEGMNNFFINIKQTTKNNNSMDKNISNKNDQIFTLIFDQMHQILSSSDLNDKLLMIENKLTNHPDITIYPSYYFNSTNFVFQEKLSDLAICTNISEQIIEQPRIKTQLKRTYKITPQGIITRLNENPKDRFKMTNL